MLIYLVTNNTNGKIYVGQTIGTIFRRWSQHKYSAYHGKQMPLLSAIRKYGHDAFSISQLDTAATREELNRLEILHISRLSSTNPEVGYNIANGGVSEMSQATKQKISDSTRGREATYRQTPESRLKISQKQTGKKQSDAVIEKRRKSHLGRKNSQEAIDNISRAHVPITFDQVLSIRRDPRSSFALSLIYGVNEKYIKRVRQGKVRVSS